MILLVGFPKSGTTSFQELFSKLGYKSIHWQCKEGYIGMIIKRNKINKVPLLTGLEKYDSITQMDVCSSASENYWPQLIDYKQLYYENKDAVIILNKRCPEKLLSSFKRFKEYDKRLYKYNPELIANKSDEGFIEFVEKHYNDVETFFNSIPEAKFIVYDIENDTIDKLKKYIDIKNISVFPKCNVNNNNK
jgi:hypothetical protein